MQSIFHIIALSLLVQLTDFSRADQLFRERENNLEAIHQANRLYEGILNQPIERALKLRAMNALGKLAFYEGELLTPESDSSKKKAIFAHTQALAEQVGSQYWRALSLALWCQAAGGVAAWWYLNDFKDAMNHALAEDNQVDGGGIYRLMAAIYIKTRDLESYGLYNPKLALEYANKALVSGPDYLHAYLLKANALKELGRGEEAKDFLRKTLQNFHSKPELAPENKVILERIKKSL